MKQEIFNLIGPGNNTTRPAKAYDIFMIASIICSLIPLAFKTSTPVLNGIDYIITVIFIADYILRFITADLRLRKDKLSYLLHPVTPMAIIDLLCILPSFSVLASGFRILKIIRLFRTLRVFRTFKVFRYSRSVEIIINVLKKQGTALLTVLGLAVGYMMISALIMFNIEPDIFNTFFDAIYWAAISLTTIGCVLSSENP